MTSTTIRVTPATRDALQALSRAEGKSIQDVTAAAVELYRRQALLGAANRAYAALAGDREAQHWKEELGIWDETLADGLER